MSASLKPTAAQPDRPATGWRDLAVVLLAAWAVRVAFLLIVPPGARSVDAHSWDTVARVLAAGGNPYQTTTFLNWPPLWLQLIFCLAKISAGLGVSFFRVLQVFLILVESAVLAALLNLIREVAPAARARAWVLAGLALNPIAVLLVCQHCNFDILVALWLLLCLTFLLRYQRTDQLPDWLLACLFLGLAILTKTVPLVLIPLLAGGFRRVPPAAKFLGLVLLLGPVSLGMSIIYVLAPADVTGKVLLYRSQMGYFGFGSLLYQAGGYGFNPLRSLLFYALLAVVVAGSWRFFWRGNRLAAGDVILYAALLLAAIPVLGPGYASQYIYWFLPLLLASGACQPRWWRLVLAGFGVVAVVTYLVEYALLEEYGYSLFYLWPATGLPAGADDWLVSVYATVESEMGRTLLLLPLFAAYLTLLVLGGGLWLHNVQASRHETFSVKLYTLTVLALVTLAFGAIALAGTGGKSARGGFVPVRLDPAARLNWEATDLNNLAWKLAVSPDARIRHGALAVRAAERACEATRYQQPTFVSTLAAAYAEAGRFEDAVTTAQKASALAAHQGDTNLASINQSFAALFQTRQPYHESPH